MLVSTSPLSQGEQRWTRHCCATDGKRQYWSQGYAVAASIAAMVTCLLTKHKEALRDQACTAWGTGRVFPPKEEEKKEWK